MNIYRIRQQLLEEGKLEQFFEICPELRHLPLNGAIPAPGPTPVERYNLEVEEKWHGISDEIPYLPPLPRGVEIKVVPPMGGTVARFLVRCRRGASRGYAGLSIYLDWYGRLGYMSGPYWEIYPYLDDTCRVPAEDGDLLVERIREALLQQGAKFGGQEEAH